MLAHPAFDTALLQRYDWPGPRYTSYPTAPQFSAEFGAEARTEQVGSKVDPEFLAAVHRALAR